MATLAVTVITAITMAALPTSSFRGRGKNERENEERRKGKSTKLFHTTLQMKLTSGQNLTLGALF